MSSKTYLRETTPAALSLPIGKYLISMDERVVRDKLRLPVVYTFRRWRDGVLSPSR